MNDVFAEVRERVPVPEAARSGGYSPNRAGFIVCPFHREKTPSLKLWQDHWYCFGCHEGGSVVDFVGKLYGLSSLDAVRKMNADYSLGLPLDRQQTRQEREAVERRRHESEVRQRFEEWREETLNQLCVALRVGNEALRRAPDTWTEEEAESVRWAAALEYWLDKLEAGELKDQMEIFRDREGVTHRCKMILGSMPKRLKLA